MSRYCIVVDLDHCLNCKTCEIACKIENGLPLGERWNRVLTCGPYGTFPDLSLYYLPVMCQQCQDAPCVSVCPTGASYHDSDTNIVLVNKEECVGCKYCIMACPYGVRSWNKDEKVVEKCTLCSQRTSVGELPFCVEICPTGCRFYGDLDDPDSDASKAIAAKPDAVHQLKDFRNAPSTVYLLSSRYGDWHEEADGWHDTNTNRTLAE
jgi:Fe-S-cluster-containing dehydrogenase component